MKTRLLLIPALAALLLGSCHSSSDDEALNRPDALFADLPASRTGIEFANTLVPNADLNILSYNYYYNGGGVAAADFNRDGKPDLYFTGNQVSSRLYLNTATAGSDAFSFTDVTDAAGATTTGWTTGVAVADVNADGWPDIYLCLAGYADPRRRANRLLINQGVDAHGQLRFVEKAAEYGLGDTGYSTQASFFDYDRDGDLDCYVVNHDQSQFNPNYPRKKNFTGTTSSRDRLYRNDGGRFTDVTLQANIRHEGYGLSVSVADLDRDGWPDIYVTNDFIFDDLLYHNNRDGTFIESLHQAVGHTSRFSMGSDIADFNNDGWPDIFVADMMPEDNRRQKLMNAGSSNELFNQSLAEGYLPQYSRNVLQLHNGALAGQPFSFREIGQLAGVSQTDWSWSSLFVDLDNDGWKDLFITNGIPHDITNNDFVAYRADELASNTNLKEVMAGLLDQIDDLPPVNKPNVVFRNNRNLTFLDESVAWGLGRRGFSNGAVYTDLDLDGDLDLVLNNLNAPASVLENRSAQLTKNRALRLRLDGQGIGAAIRVVAGGKAQFFEHRLQRGFESSQEDVVHIGMGTFPKADTVEVRWPSGRFQRLLAVDSNQLLIVNEKDALPSAAAPPLPSVRPQPLLTDVTAAHKLVFTPPENELEEFNMEPLLPHRFSRQGPCLAVADVNGDGRDDFFVGGSAKNPGQLFIQNAMGTFQAIAMPDPGFEDTGALFFDADGDNHPDLYVVSGGAEYNPGTAAYADRLYLNDGIGNFARIKTALPPLYTSGFSVAAADFDRDGDLDLFVGGRFVPGQYPVPAESYLLANDGRGNFRDVTTQLCPALKRPGLVTAAVWADANGDGWPDLLVSGEWMPLLLFTNQQGRALAQQSVPALNATKGWWSSLVAGDFDGDGDLDFLAGNAGTNTRLKIPLHVYAADFDGNGTVEPILTHRMQERNVPYLSRDLLATQYPAIKKKFPRHGDYANAAIDDLFAPEQLAKALNLTATELRSMYIENLGNGQFKIRPLPIEAQVAPIQSMIVRDVNDDGHPDVLAGSNWFDPDPTAGRFDAGGVVVLLGDNKGHFSVLSKPATGLHLTSDVRTIQIIRVRGADCVLVGSNSAPLRLLRLQKPKAVL